MSLVMGDADERDVPGAEARGSTDDPGQFDPLLLGEARYAEDWPTPMTLACGDFAPEPSMGDARSAAVLLGKWMSPDRFPWAVTVLRCDWFEAPGIREGAVDNPNAELFRRRGRVVAERVPCALLWPCPWAYPAYDILVEYETWFAKRRKSGVAWCDAPNGRLVVWRSRENPSHDPWLAWSNTLAAAMDVGMRLPDPGRQRTEFLKEACATRPWLPAVSREIVEVAAQDLRIPGPIGAEIPLECLHAAARDDGWLAGRTPPRTPKPARDLEVARIGAFEALVDRGVSATLAARFCYSSKRGHPPVARSASKWRDALFDKGIEPMLIPLSTHRADFGGIDPAHWALRWVGAGAAEPTLWRLFGRSVDHFAWAAVRTDGRAATHRRPGLKILHGRPAIASVEATPSAIFAGHRLVWCDVAGAGDAGPADGDPAAGPAQVSATLGSSGPR